MWRKLKIARGRDNFASVSNKHGAINVYGEMDTYLHLRATAVRIAAILEESPQPLFLFRRFYDGKEHHVEDTFVRPSIRI